MSSFQPSFFMAEATSITALRTAASLMALVALPGGGSFTPSVMRMICFELVSGSSFTYL
jgi:hypothetical protein